MADQTKTEVTQNEIASPSAYGAGTYGDVSQYSGAGLIIFRGATYGSGEYEADHYILEEYS